MRSYIKSFISLSIICNLLSGCFPAAFVAASGVTLLGAQERSIGDAYDDGTIWAGVSSKLFKSNNKSDYAKISVTVNEGRVLLTGFADSEDILLKAVEIAWTQEGVKEVINEIKVETDDNKIRLGTYLKDSWITSQVKTKFLVNKDIKNINYTVITIRSVVYLFGIAQNEDELKIAAEVAGTVSGVNKVVSHIRVKNSISRMKTLSKFKD